MEKQNELTNRQVKLKFALDRLFSAPESLPFQEPVNWRAQGLIDYPQKILQPMDLGTVRDKLKSYKSYSEFFEDVSRIWTNCKLYNQEGSLIYKQAVKMEKIMKQEYNKITHKGKTYGTKANSKNQKNDNKQEDEPGISKKQKNEKLDMSQKLNLSFSFVNSNDQNIFDVLCILLKNKPEAVNFNQNPNQQISASFNLSSLDQNIYNQINSNLNMNEK